MAADGDNAFLAAFAGQIRISRLWGKSSARRPGLSGFPFGLSGSVRLCVCFPFPSSSPCPCRPRCFFPRRFGWPGSGRAIFFGLWRERCPVLFNGELFRICRIALQFQGAGGQIRRQCFQINAYAGIGLLGRHGRPMKKSRRCEQQCMEDCRQGYSQDENTSAGCSPLHYDEAAGHDQFPGFACREIFFRPAFFKASSTLKSS